MEYFWQIVELFAYAIVFYFFWDIITNKEVIAGRERNEPWVRKIKY
ncbi:hypothetical protein HZC09_02715 [Candidatus Micrarchaeota archaeon]|nr:hypothetical protein [Candidatus Micrarchaeota archaeon]